MRMQRKEETETVERWGEAECKRVGVREEIQVPEVDLCDECQDGGEGKRYVFVT